MTQTMQQSINRLLVIANPAAQNGRGERAAYVVRDFLKQQARINHIELELTTHQNHARLLAERAASFDAVAAVGGDGTVHEVVNGLMVIPRDARPMFGLIPVGSGNDYARTLGMSTKVETALQQFLNSRPRRLDVGRCNGEYFVQTLSFGLDAAIAHETIERRVQTGSTGTRLFFEAGVNQLINHLDTFNYALKLDQLPQKSGKTFLLAVQIGQTYGGGFRVCPKAQPDDGIFDICIAHPPISVPKALLIFLLAKNGWHTAFNEIQFFRSSTIELMFEGIQPVAQIDGEILSAPRYEIDIFQKELVVCSNTLKS